MKKTIIISAIALGFAIHTSNAANQVKEVAFTSFIKTKVEVNPFCMSIVKGDVATVKKLIELGADVNATSNGMTPAMYAAKYNKTEILKILVTHGANLKKKSEKGLTALDYAKQSKATDALAYLAAKS